MSCIICNELLHHMCEPCNKSKLSTPSWHELLTQVYLWTNHLCILHLNTLVYLRLSFNYQNQTRTFQSTNAILVVIDKFTKFGHFLPLHHPFAAQTMARLFIDQQTPWSPFSYYFRQGQNFHKCSMKTVISVGWYWIASYHCLSPADWQPNRET